MIPVLFYFGCVGLWLVFEWRASRKIRVAVGLFCFLVGGFFVAIITEAENAIGIMHVMVLRDIEKELGSGKTQKVIDALDFYQETYDETGSVKRAVHSMNDFLHHSYKLGNESEKATQLDLK